MEMESKVYLKFLFPNLIIFLDQNKKDSLFRQIQKCFNEFQYQHLFKTEGTRYKNELGREISTCRIMQGVQVHVCLAEGEGILPGDAEQQAVERLLNKLCDSFYVIKANPQYFSKKCVPPMVLNADPSQRHVYKVVFLKKNSLGVSFPKPVSGAIDYVEDYNELFTYIDTQAQSDKKPDIFVLNILKADRPKIRKVCQRNKYSTRNLIGCSDMGVHAFVTLSTLMIQQSLLKDGGKNVKYKFIGPRDKYGDNEDKFDKHCDSKVATAQYEHLKQEGGEIVINQWIAEHLVLMDFFTESNELESVKEIIWRSVRDCPDTQEFIIEKTRSDGGVIYADAMIDRKVVGRARGYNIDQVKIEAARNAMDNLSKHCHYITAKRSYFGSSQELPNFLQDRIPIPQTKIYRVERKTDYPPNKILQQFKGSSLEDLYFLHDFSDGERQNIALLAKGMKFLVRWIGWKHILCVYKRRKPKEVLMELLSTKFKENEKYKLIIPKEKCETRLAPPSSATRMKQEVEGSIIKQEGSCRRLSVDAQADLESSDLRTSPSMSQPQASSQDHRVQHDDHKEVSSVQESEDLGQASNDIPEWVKKYIQTAPSKPTKHENPPKLENNLPETPKFKQTKVQKDVYSRYKFIPPKAIIPQQIHSPNFNNRGAYQRHNQNFNNRGAYKWHNQNLNNRGVYQSPNPNFDQEPKGSFIGPSSGQSLDQGVDERLNHNSNQEVDQRPNQTLNQGTDQKSNQNFKQEISQGINKTSCEDDEKDLSLSERLHRKLAAMKNRSNNQDSVNQSNEQSSSSTNKRTFSDSTVGTESPQHSNSLVNKGINQHYDQKPNTSIGGQKKFSNLFDFNGPSDAQACPKTPRVTWVKNKKFKGHSFSKLAKYGQQRGRRGGF